MNKQKIAFLFPGQGSQYIGMGKEFSANFPYAKDLFKKANNVLDFDITSLCFNGPEDDLRLTQNTQPAILIASVIASGILRENGVTPDISAGHSLGEYSALVDAGALSFEDAVSVVRKRGMFMQDAVPKGVGGMAAIIGMVKDEVNKLCTLCSEAGLVVPANYNSPMQTVIAGDLKAVELAVKNASEMGAKRAVMLPVSAPFHCSLMKPAEDRLSVELDKIEFSDLKNPVVTNVDAKENSLAQVAKTSVKRQVSSPVLWEDTIRHLLEKDVTIFVEVGPGRVLSGLMRNIERSAKVLSVENIKSLEKALQFFKSNS